jgi:type I restriction enzyme S subunit
VSDWANAPIRSVVEDKETWNPRKDTRKYVEYLEIAGVDNSSGQIISTRRIEVSSPPSRAKRVIRKGDVVFGTTRPYLKNIAVVPENLDEQVCSTGFCVLRPDHKKVITEWLFSICRSDVVVDQVVPGQEKNAYPAVSDAAVMDSIIPVPPLNEHRGADPSRRNSGRNCDCA